MADSEPLPKEMGQIMTITKEQIARLRELEEKATSKPWDHEEGELYAGSESLPVNRYDLDLIVESRNLLPALLDEIERLQDIDTKMQTVLFCTKGLDVFGEQEGIDEILAGLNEWADKKALEKLESEGARVFDAVLSNLLETCSTWGEPCVRHLESQRERILGGVE